MKTQWKLTLVLLGLLCFVFIANCGEENTPDVHRLEDTKINFRKSSLPNFLNFSEFKRKFRRGYANTVEEMSRRKIYLFRSLEVFLNAILYKMKKNPSYLAINQFSDRTPKELWNLMMSDMETRLDLNTVSEATVSEQLDSKQEIVKNKLSVDTIGIEEEIEVLKEHKDEPGFKELADVIDLDTMLSKSRKRRNVDNFKPEKEKIVGERSPKKSESKPKSSVMNKISNFKISIFDTKTKKKPDGEMASQHDDKISIDHRDSGCFSPPRDQGFRCQSSYAFSSIAFYEWAHCKATGKLVAFSEQYIVDCGTRVSRSFDGCRGGSVKKIGEFVNEYGLELLNNYPYADQQLECPYNEQTGHEEMGYIRIPNLKAEEFSSDKIDEVLKSSPILISMKVNKLFFFYSDGVDSGKGCRETEGYQAALIVGSGKQEGQPYWLIRNSFSVNWGLKGYYKLSKSSDCLAPARQGYLLRPQFDSNEEKNINQNYDGYEIRKRQEQIVASLGKLNRKKQVKRGKNGY